VPEPTVVPDETDEAAPVGPSPAEEATFLARETEAEAPEPPPTAEPNGNGNTADLPPLADLVKRIPAPTRQMLEETFRAKFVTVKRVPKSALKS
jgi:hypothetical protein